jgi:predicted nucleic acid-binding protein
MNDTVPPVSIVGLIVLSALATCSGRNAEILKGIRAGHGGLTAIPEAVEAGRLTEVPLISRKEKILFESLSISLGLGEASSLAVAACRGFRFASDDQAARRTALSLRS